MSLGEILSFAKENGFTVIVVLGILAKLIDVSPLKINPWKKLWSLIGNAINANVISEIKGIEAKQKSIEEKLDKHIQDDDERDADMRRQRILRFNADIMNGKNFTHEFFCEMLLEIDTYEHYCDAHPGYKNNRAVMAIRNIIRVCESHEHNNDFERADVDTHNDEA